jgi:hypothetical protein
MAVRLRVGADSVEPSAPRELFRLPLPSFRGGGIGSSPYEVSRDGRRFLTVTSAEEGAQPLTLVVNWPALLKKGTAAQ